MVLVLVEEETVEGAAVAQPLNVGASEALVVGAAQFHGATGRSHSEWQRSSAGEHLLAVTVSLLELASSYRKSRTTLTNSEMMGATRSARDPFLSLTIVRNCFRLVYIQITPSKEKRKPPPVPCPWRFRTPVGSFRHRRFRTSPHRIDNRGHPPRCR